MHNTQEKREERTPLDEYREQIDRIDGEIFRELAYAYHWSFSSTEVYIEGWLEANFARIILGMLQEPLFRDIFQDCEGRILNLLSQRFQVVKNVGVYKKERGMASMQPERWKKVKYSRIQWATDLRFFELDWIIRFLEEMHTYALSLEDEIVLSSQGFPKVSENVTHVLNQGA